MRTHQAIFPAIFTLFFLPMTLVSNAFAQFIPPDQVIAIETLPGAGLDGDGVLSINPLNGVIQLADLGTRYTAIVNLPLRIRLANGASFDHRVILTPSRGSVAGQLLPGRFGALNQAQSNVAYVGRVSGRGNPTLLMNVMNGFRFEDGCCNRGGAAYISFVMRLSGISIDPINDGGFIDIRPL